MQKDPDTGRMMPMQPAAVSKVIQRLSKKVFDPEEVMAMRQGYIDSVTSAMKVHWGAIEKKLRSLILTLPPSLSGPLHSSGAAFGVSSNSHSLSRLSFGAPSSSSITAVETSVLPYEAGCRAIQQTLALVSASDDSALATLVKKYSTPVQPPIPYPVDGSSEGGIVPSYRKPIRWSINLNALKRHVLSHRGAAFDDPQQPFATAPPTAATTRNMCPRPPGLSSATMGEDGEKYSNFMMTRYGKDGCVERCVQRSTLTAATATDATTTKKSRPYFGLTSTEKLAEKFTAMKDHEEQAVKDHNTICQATSNRMFCGCEMCQKRQVLDAAATVNALPKSRPRSASTTARTQQLLSELPYAVEPDCAFMESLIADYRKKKMEKIRSALIQAVKTTQETGGTPLGASMLFGQTASGGPDGVASKRAGHGHGKPPISAAAKPRQHSIDDGHESEDALAKKKLSRLELMFALNTVPGLYVSILEAQDMVVSMEQDLKRTEQVAAAAAATAASNSTPTPPNRPRRPLSARPASKTSTPLPMTQPPSVAFKHKGGTTAAVAAAAAQSSEGLTVQGFLNRFGTEMCKSKSMRSTTIPDPPVVMMVHRADDTASSHLSSASGGGSIKPPPSAMEWPGATPPEVECTVNTCRERRWSELRQQAQRIRKEQLSRRQKR